MGAGLITGILPAAILTEGAVESVLLVIEGATKYSEAALKYKDAVESTHALLTK